ncbi:hypothetical protein NQ317_008006 [Molorchus minor]|uniref:Uncharacterized protein n=1 Tax=Molorchus minor TaxID=1323400 RepID=A0ABQ9J779_9CUCU|nr:hypothetical protein NQ317_008006 [Molorchus minor]
MSCELLLKFWEIEVSLKPILSEEEALAEQHFSQTFRRSSSDDLHFSTSDNAKTLGLFWSSKEDTFSFQIDSSFKVKEVAKIFDPLGLISPVVVTAKIMLQSLWLLGLSWDQEPEHNWPEDISLKGSASTQELPEIKPTQTFVAQEDNLFPTFHFSSLTRLKRVMAYCLRFIRNLRQHKDQRQYGVLTHEELQLSMQVLLRLAQQESFPTEFQSLTKNQVVDKTSKLISLTPFLDDNGIIRVGGRLKHSLYPFTKKHPVVLSFEPPVDMSHF